MAGTPPQPPIPICPRCGYDQSGVVATWQSACPLTGVCSECGLQLDWALVLSPEELGPPWSAEHGASLTVARLARGWRRAVFQRHLWREFDIAYPIRPRRLLGLLFFSLVAFHFMLAGTLALAAAAELQLGGWANPRPMSPAIWFFPYDDAISIPVAPGSRTIVEIGPILLLTFTTFVVPALVMLVFTQSMSRIGVRWEHVLRGFAYAAPGTGPAAVCIIGGVVGIALLDQVAPIGETWAAALLGFTIVLWWPVLQVLRWRSFVKHYLRLPHATGIAASMLVILVLSTMVAFLLVSLLNPDW